MSSLPEGIVIRNSIEDDCEQVLELIKELAVYENLLPQMRLTANQLRADGFGKDPFYQCLVVENKGSSENRETKLIGYAVFFKKYSTFEGRSLWLEDIYVSPAFRKQGIGMALFKQVVKQAVADGCVRLDFPVLSWNHSAVEFYNQLGAVDLTKLEDWHYFRIHEEPLKKLASC